MIKPIGNNGAKSSGPAGCFVPGCKGGGGGLGKSELMLYQDFGAFDFSWEGPEVFHNFKNEYGSLLDANFSSVSSGDTNRLNTVEVSVDDLIRILTFKVKRPQFFW